MLDTVGFRPLEAQKLARFLVKRYLRVHAPLCVDEWAERHMIIPRDTGAAEPGPYRLDRTPYAREPLQRLSESDPCRRVVVRGASQMLKTQVGLCFFGSSVHQAPANLLVLLPTGGLTKRVSKRIAKTIAAVPVLQERVAEPRSRDSSNTIDTKEYPGGTMYIATAGSAANLAEIPARYIWGDEIDQWETNVDGEGDPISLADKRTNTFRSNSKQYLCSSPRQKATSQIDRLIEESTDKVYHVPCPHCQHMHELVWDNVRADEKATRAWMVCPECGAEIEERHKPDILRGGKWHARREGDGQTEGFTISALYMPLGWSAWLDLVKERRQAEAKAKTGDDELLRTFMNTRLAESYETSGTKVNADVLQARAELLPQRFVPMQASVVTAAVDVQDDRLEYCAVAWGRGEEWWVVDYGVLPGDPAEMKVWDDLDDWRKRPFEHESGTRLQVSALDIDTGGHHTHQVYAYARLRESDRVYGVKGSHDPTMAVKGPARLMDMNYQGRILKHGVRLWWVGTHLAKDILAARLKLDMPGPGYGHFGDWLAPTWYEGLMTEERTLVRTSRGTTWRWIKPVRSSRNEPWDLLVYNLHAAHTLDMHTWTDADWDRRERVLRVEKRAPDSRLNIDITKSARFGGNARHR